MLKDTNTVHITIVISKRTRQEEKNQSRISDGTQKLFLTRIT